MNRVLLTAMLDGSEFVFYEDGTYRLTEWELEDNSYFWRIHEDELQYKINSPHWPKEVNDTWSNFKNDIWHVLDEDAVEDYFNIIDRIINEIIAERELFKP